MAKGFPIPDEQYELFPKIIAEWEIIRPHLIELVAQLNALGAISQATIAQKALNEMSETIGQNADAMKELLKERGDE